MKELSLILQDLEQGKISVDNAEQQILDLFAVSSLACPKCKSEAIAEYPDYKECRICGNVW